MQLDTTKPPTPYTLGCSSNSTREMLAKKWRRTAELLLLLLLAKGQKMAVAVVAAVVVVLHWMVAPIQTRRIMVP